MGKGDEFKEYKKSKLTSGDIGIRIIGTTENLELGSRQQNAEIPR